MLFRSWAGVDVAIDFTTPDAVVGNVEALARRGLNIVLGTTGWQRHEPALRAAIAAGGTGIVAAPNFSTGVVIPDSALIETGLRQIVFVDLGGGSLEPREVTVGVRGDGKAQILSGVKEGDRVAVRLLRVDVEKGFIDFGVG